MRSTHDTEHGTGRITLEELSRHPEMKRVVPDLPSDARSELFAEFIEKNGVKRANPLPPVPNNWGWHLLDPVRREPVGITPMRLHELNRLSFDQLGVGIVEVLGAEPGIIEPADFTRDQLRAICALNRDLLSGPALERYPELRDIAREPGMDPVGASQPIGLGIDTDAAIARLPVAGAGDIAAMLAWAEEKEAAIDAVSFDTPAVWGDYIAVHDAAGGISEICGYEPTRYIEVADFEEIVGADATALDLVSGATGVRSRYAPFSIEQAASAILAPDASVAETMNGYAAAMCSHDGERTERFREQAFTPDMYTPSRLSNMLQWRPERLGVDQMRKWPSLREAAGRFSMKAKEFVMADWLRDVGLKIEAAAAGRPGPARWGEQVCFTETGHALTREEFDAIVPPEYQALYLAAESATSRSARQQAIRDADDPAALEASVGGPRSAPAYLVTVIEPSSYSERDLENVIELRSDLADAASRARYPEVDRAARAVEARREPAGGRERACGHGAAPMREGGMLARRDRGGR